MAAPVGFEPTTVRLTAARSAIELWGTTISLNSGMGTAGIEPASPGLQPGAKPSSATFPIGGG